MTEMTQEKIINGVDVKAVEGLFNTLKEDAGKAQFKFRLHNKWIDGGHSKSTVGNFYGLNQEHEHQKTFEFLADEPPLLGGKDRGANPVEHLLNALTDCLTGAIVYHAAVRGIKIYELESDLEGDIDLRGFLGVSNEVRKGYKNIRINFKVKTDAPDQDLGKLKALSNFSPVYDVATKGTNVEINIERKA